MKCEKCGKEACFHYQSNINGETTEYHLCPECAQAEGFGNMMSMRPRSMFDSFWADPFESLLGGFFGSPFGGLMGGRLMTPTLTLPQINIQVGDPEASTKTQEEKADNIPEDAGREIKSRRELMSLKHQLKAAVKAEEFEKAAELRDKIRELEK